MKDWTNTSRVSSEIIVKSLEHTIATVSEAAIGAFLTKNAFLKNYAKFTGKHLCSSIFL